MLVLLLLLLLALLLYCCCWCCWLSCCWCCCWCCWWWCCYWAGAAGAAADAIAAGGSVAAGCGAAAGAAAAGAGAAGGAAGGAEMEEGAGDHAPRGSRGPRQDPETRLDCKLNGHILEQYPPTAKKTCPTRRCRVCLKKKIRSETAYRCKKCDVALHPVCFFAFHNKKDYTR